ncbi:MAG TPA: isoprenylcysteine carboxylmethyltransferase family protein [Candidatus Sulfotelmatobacter sp.]|jgi:protein-S-isoprenylcysteine O-methyltransferase Ste14|nr:isoprenylcysteine carboxylmethyltransferase family protein [Candidatus Sulfotelmatobacter sp.]
MEKRLRTLNLLFLVGAVVLVFVLVTWRSPWNLQRYIGTVLAIVGISFVALARYQLGASFSVNAKAHKLVTSGIYSKIRNPIYVFGLLLLTGLALVLQQPAFWIFLAIVVVLQTVRARQEAKVLEAAFGEQYREYRRKTWF